MNNPSYLDNFLYIEWIITFGCNYKCTYCFWANNLYKRAYMFHNRGPKLPRNTIEKLAFPLLRKLNVLQYADSFDNYPLEKWIDLFCELYKGKTAYLSFTGGEPLVHYKKIIPIVEAISKVSSNMLLRFDTNGSIVPEFPDELKKKITYNVSFHDTQIKSLEQYLNNLDLISKQGTVHMVNRIIHTEDMLERVVYEEMKMFRERGYFLNITPAFFNIKSWKEKNQELLKKVIHPLDFNAKILGQTKGKHCEYPKFGFQLLPNGYAWMPPCDTKKVINLMQERKLDKLLYKDGMACPTDKCVCLHQYSFQGSLIRRNLQNFDILKNYVDSQLEHRKQSGLIS